MAKKKSSSEMDNWITTAQAADLLGVTQVYILSLLANGTLEGRKVNSRLWLVNKESLANWQPKRDWRRGKPRER